MQARSRSIKVLDHAMSGPAGTVACETFVEALGLKNLFSTFMGKVRVHFSDRHDIVCFLISHTLAIRQKRTKETL